MRNYDKDFWGAGSILIKIKLIKKSVFYYHEIKHTWYTLIQHNIVLNNYKNNKYPSQE